MFGRCVLQVHAAATGGGNVVVGGGGLVACELAGNLAEAMVKAKSKGTLTMVSSSKALVPGHPPRVQVGKKSRE